MKKFVIYLISAMLALTIYVPVSASSISELQKQQDEAKAKAQQVQEQLDNAQMQKSKVLAEVEALDAELTEVTDMLNIINSELEDTNRELEMTKKELDEAEELKDAQYVTLQQRARFMYESGATGYLDILFSSGSFSDFLNRLDYVNYIYKSDQEMLDKYTETENLIEQKRIDIEDHKLEIEILIDQQSKKIEQVEDAIAKKEANLMQLMADEAKFEQQINDWAQAEKSIQTLIKKAEEEAKRKAEEEAKRKAEAEAASKKANELAAKKSYYTGGLLEWPVPGNYNISSQYGYRLNPFDKKTREMHTGTDISAATGKDIVAAEAGLVIFVGVKGGYGNTVIIDHGAGMTTLYAHASKLIAKQGQEVKRGQIIAKIGSTGYSTGPHLHFEVRKNGSHTNPESYLKSR